MSQYMKNFIYASLTYLGLAAIFGVLNGTTNIGYFGIFAHTHFNLLGFMSMMIYGIGYFILPRFNGTDLRYPGWVKIHFWVGNLSLIAMVIFRGMEVSTGENFYSLLFIISASLQILTIFMFIYNIWVSLSPAKPQTTEKLQSAPGSQNQTNSSVKKFEVTVHSKISDLYDINPATLQILVDEGVHALGMPGHINKVREMGITVGMVTQNHNLNLKRVIDRLSQELNREIKITTGDINANTLIGDIMAKYPKSKAIFQKYFGDGCFDCPGQSYESVDMACRMHGVDSRQFLNDLTNQLK